MIPEFGAILLTMCGKYVSVEGGHFDTHNDALGCQHRDKTWWQRHVSYTSTSAGQAGECLVSVLLRLCVCLLEEELPHHAKTRWPLGTLHRGNIVANGLGQRARIMAIVASNGL